MLKVQFIFSGKLRTEEGGNKMLFDKNRNSWETFSSIFVYSVLDMENIVCRFVHENK